MDRVKMGLIGHGCRGWGLLEILLSLEDVDVIAVCDKYEDRAKSAFDKVKEKNGNEPFMTTDYKELLKDATIDVVHVCTPNRSHNFITVDALEAGKHVMCEKPMAINAEEAKKMLDAAERTGKLLTIGYQNRQRKDSKYLKAEADDGVFGDIYYAKATALRRRAVPTWGVFINEYEQGGGPLIDIGTHALDLTLWTMNNYKPKYCVGTTYHKLNQQTETANVFGDWKPEEFTVEDSAFGFIVMENGATIVLESSWAINMTETKEACTTICGTKAGARMFDQGVLEINGVKHGNMYETRPNLDGKGVPFYDAGSYDPAYEEAKQWISAVTSGTPLTVLPEQAYTVTRILEGIYESAKSGKPYYFD